MSTADRTPLPIEPSVLIRQTERLAADLPGLVETVYARAADALAAAGGGPWSRVCLVGDGDSYHAGCAAETAFETLAGLPCEPQPAQRFLGYHLDVVPEGPRDTLVVAVSSSGRTERVLQAVERARARGITTVAVTGRPASPLARAADAHIDVSLTDLERSPGIRTYQASLLGLLLLAVRLGTERHGEDRSRGLRAELTALAEPLAATAQALKEPCVELGRALSDAPVIAVAGTGPGEGTAQYAAAKLVEGAGVMACGRDLEEWWHVERFAAPLDMPLVVLAPPGRAQERAADLAIRAAALGRRVAVVAPAGDALRFGPDVTVLPVRGETREPFSPLLYHVFAGHLAFGLAQNLGRRPFQGHRPTGPALV
ncbi:SIS domain-containing protein [Streptomyces echinoruber]|uniref:Glutamine--fructose-6-phosphate aminotransferase [isomerizing] n=1 Tax=Streptomyces echinoruber TaxID=68898 RepID=A0A918QSU3_9ACTN|nr:SIS domain-containing protein [Streptomyces echinoruber]GGZ70908.1 hypothetical protein GCM10010389_05510 [Streptomyces echinoruber]